MSCLSRAFSILFMTCLAVTAVAVGGAWGRVNEPATESAPAPTQLAISRPPASADPSPSPIPTPLPGPISSSASMRSSGVARGADREIVVSVSEQHLWAYEHGRLVAESVVVTGRPELPTPTGSFHIRTKYSPYRFVSPWPKGSPYYYAPLWSTYAMEYQSDGYFIHDAPWRSDWAYGANVRGGSHGCVNVPTAEMSTVYHWARTGDLVVVQS